MIQKSWGKCLPLLNCYYCGPSVEEVITYLHICPPQKQIS